MVCHWDDAAVTDEADYVCGSTMFVDGGMTLFPRFA
jgi:hypothetical protein